MILRLLTWEDPASVCFKVAALQLGRSYNVTDLLCDAAAHCHMTFVMGEPPNELTE